MNPVSNRPYNSVNYDNQSSSQITPGRLRPMEMSALRDALPPRNDRTKETRPRRSRPPASDASSHTTVSARSYSSTSTHDGGASVRSSSESISERSSISGFVSRADSERSSADTRAQLYRVVSRPQSVTQRASGKRSSTADFISRADSQISSVDSRARMYRADPRSLTASKREFGPQFALYPAFPQPFQPAYASQYRYARSAGSSTVRFTPGSSWREPGCVVTSCATIAKVPYEKAREVAQRVADFDGSSGMDFYEAKDILSDLGVKSTRHQQGSKWSDLPNLAIVSVHSTQNVGVLHAVVFKRKNGQELIYDNGIVKSPSQFPVPIPTRRRRRIP